ncbi:MAG TPA: MIP family channel protein [Dehalococcoidia bacterium]|nr:MIP family channel protein [Dehalococcoidia bacterium]
MKTYIAEFLGTFLLVFAGTGAIVIDADSRGDLTSLGIGLSFGLAVMSAIYALGHISGAHINPAVTISFALGRHFPWLNVPGYIGAQLAGAATASGVLRLLFGNVANLGATSPSETAAQALGMEIALSFFLMFLIMAVATDVRAVGQAAALAIGGYVGLAAVFAGPVAGASMNPARSLGPALVSQHWESHWVYWLGPVAGAIFGALAYRYLRDAQPPKPTEDNSNAAKNRKMEMKL